MPFFFIHATFFLFFLTALSGIWMRAMPFFSSLSYNYENILHAHSHGAILGWAFLGILIIFIALLWKRMGYKQKKQAYLLVFATLITTLLMFITFVYQGYATYSIIMSTLHIFVEYWAIFFIFKEMKLQRTFSKVGKLYLYGALISLGISTLGPFLLGFLGATGLRDSNLFELAIYFFLHFQYNGWLFLFLMGTFIYILERKKISISTTYLRIGFIIYFISLFPWYMSSIMWADLNSFSAIVAMIGDLGQWIAIIIMLLAIINAWRSIQIKLSRLTRICLQMTLLLLFIKSTMELGLIIPSLADLVYNTRNIVVGYLHLTLLGFVSLFILTQFLMITILNPYRKSVISGLKVFFSGFILNELILFLMGLMDWLNIGAIPYTAEGLLLSSILLLIGISLLWMTTIMQEKTNHNLQL